jgi:Ca2+-binding EF-hand superfamily protein
MAPRLEPEQQLLSSVRQKINAAKVRTKQSWEQLFHECDKDGSGTLSLQELKATIRSTLKMPPNAVCDHEIGVLFAALDSDGSGDVELQELLEYLQRGQRSEEEEEARKAQQIKRTKKNLQMAFSKINCNEAAVRQMFAKIDADGGGKLSICEFTDFVRQDLKLSTWDCKNRDLTVLFETMDENGDGIDVDEFFAYLKGVTSTKAACPSNLAPQSITQYGGKAVRRRQTYRQLLQNDCTASYRLSKTESQPQIPQLSSFVSLGRSAAPASRMAMSSATDFVRMGTNPRLHSRDGTTGRKAVKGSMSHPNIDKIMNRLKDSGVEI